MSELISTKDVVTRKPHRCFGCAREFPFRTKMQKDFIVDGKPFTSYLCETCQEVVSKWAYDEEFGYGDLREDAEELERKHEQDGGAE